ncbi:MAG: TonB-dependent receptor [Acidobacteria bacterium]|nr:TonB-dependent receptor [Acidobacteriota bacterium]MCW5969439.1 TonB-dependent receptor [Blastocatellales bacterium]
MPPILTRFVLAALFVAAGALGVARAQALYGSVIGNVTDPQGALLPGVRVVITNTGTGLSLDATTDESGAYVFRNLLPGNYDMVLSHSGFRELRQSGISVTAGNPRRLDVTLQIGAAQDTVTVTADAATLRTEKADLSTEINSLQVISLPLNQYRNYQTLLNLVPGATPVQFQNAEIDTPGRSLRTWVNGTQPNSNTTRVDGAVSVNVWLPHHAGYIQPVETIETVNIATNNFDADIGMAGGAAQTVVTKSGTNEFRGSAFWFFNGDKLNANSFFNNANGLVRAPLSRNTFGGTVGGPIKKDKVFFFTSWEQFRDRRTGNFTYTVPTDKMRNGDFSEVAASYANFRLFNPNTGDATSGVGREAFANFMIPSAMISPIARSVMNFYPRVNSTRDINANQLLDDFIQQRTVEVDRGNYDGRLTWQRTREHSIWGKFSTLRANVIDNFQLGFDEGSLGDTKVYVVSIGHTWTLSPTLLLDGNFGYNRQDQTVTGPDFGTNFGLDLGIPGVNDPNDIRASGLPTFNNGYSIGTTPNWMPLFRKEVNYSFSSALTKIFPKHELRLGIDIVKLELNHRQAEFGNFGLKGGFTFSGNITGAPNYVALQWNSFAAFLLGRASFFSKDVQTEDMTGREWQNAFYIRDRWRITPNLTVNLGLRVEHYPLMTRANSGIERLDYSTYTVLLGGRGDVPKDVGLKLKNWYLAPRLGVAYRVGDNSVIRVGYGRTINPLPWSRPLRGSFPYDITFNNTAEQFATLTTLNSGIPAVPIPDFSSGRVRLPVNVFMRSPNFDFEAFPGAGRGLDRAVIQQYNVAFEHKLPWDVITEVAYVGTRTDSGYADLNINYGEPGGGNAARKFFSVAGNTAINDWGARTRSRYNSLQVAINRPFTKALMLKGAYTLSKARNMADEDGWVGLTWNHPLKFEDNFALAGFDRTHIFQMGFVYGLPFLRDASNLTGKLLGGWQLNGIYAKYSGTPFSIGGVNNALNCQGCGSVFINVNGDPKPVGRVGAYSTETYYDKSLFSQPTGVAKQGFGTSARNQFRRPRVWNLDLSLFKQFRLTERLQPEFRLEAVNVFNHVNWGAPVTGFTANNFLEFIPANAENGTNTPGARRVQLGLRLAF